MKKIKGQMIPMFISLIASFIVLIASYYLKEATFRDKALYWILYISLSLVAILILYSFVAQYVPRLKKSIWLPTIPYAVIVYLGFLILSLSSYKDLLLNMSWDPGMASLGLAGAAFGWGLFIQHEKLQTKETSEELEANISTSSAKMVALNEKFRKLEKVTDAFLEESQKLAKRLTAIQKEEKDKS